MTDHTEADLRHILGYIGVVRDALRMQNWDVTLHRHVGENEDNFAETFQATQADVLNIVLGPEFFGRPPKSIRNTVIHELVHAQHRDVSIMWELCTQQNSDLPTSQAMSWDHDFTTHLERFVSWIARAVAPTVPVYDPDGEYPLGMGLYLKGEEIV